MAELVAEQTVKATTRETVDPSESDEEEGQEDEKERTQEQCDGEGDGKDSHQLRWWHVNKTGFPITEETWERMWDHVIRVHPQGSQVAESIRGMPISKKVDNDQECVGHLSCALSPLSCHFHLYPPSPPPLHTMRAS